MTLFTFLANDRLHDRIKKKLPTSEKAIQILKDEFKNFKQQFVESTASTSKCSFVDAFGSSPKSNQTNTPPSKKRKFQVMKDLVASPSPSHTEFNEIEKYLEMSILDADENDDPLKFWLCYEKKFPILSKMARTFLGMPASSGSVERLFSVAGSIARARRANLKIDTLEMMLCYRQFLINREKTERENNA